MTSGSAAPAEAVFQALIRDFQDIGIEIEGQTMAWPAFFDQIKARTYKGIWVAANWDAGRFVEIARLGRRPTATVNTGIETPVTLAIAESVSAAATNEEEVRLRGELFDIFFDEQYILPLFEMKTLIAMDPNTISEWPMSFGAAHAWIWNPEEAKRAK